MSWHLNDRTLRQSHLDASPRNILKTMKVRVNAVFWRNISAKKVDHQHPILKVFNTVFDTIMISF